MLDLVGGCQVETYILCQKAGGRYVVSGAMAGFKVRIVLRTLSMRQLVMYGSSMGNRHDVQGLYAKIWRCVFTPHIELLFPLRDTLLAQDQFQARMHICSFMLTPYCTF